MFKRFFLAFALTVGLLSPTYGAGTIPLSLSQRFDNSTHLPLAGGQLYSIQAGTTSTPQNAYQDSALTIPYANPLTLDAGGNIPQLFYADGQIKIRLTNAAGTVQLSVDNIQVVGASSGSGGGGTVDPTTILTTGDIKVVYGTGVVSGFVRLNGRTIGSATSGATERANSDTNALFLYLWGADANLAVSTGRGASAAADWAANKTIALPDGRDRSLAGLGDMGNSDAGRLTSTYFGATSVGSCTSTTLGCAGGSESQTLSLAQLPTGITATGSGWSVVGASNSALSFMTANSQSASFSANAGSQVWQAQAQAAVVLTQAATTGGSVTSNNTSGVAHPIVPNVLLITVYMKL